MNKTHILKLHKRYEQAKLKGYKPFEIRLNDRAFKLGDYVRYKIVNDNDIEIKSELSKKKFQIVFITDFMQRRDYIVYGEIEIKEDEIIAQTPTTMQYKNLSGEEK